MNITNNPGESVYTFAGRAVRQLRSNSFDSSCTVVFNGFAVTCYSSSFADDVAEKIMMKMELDTGRKLF
jgi:hypothetical protein